MSDELNWYLLPSSNSLTTVKPGRERYDLFNEYVLQRLVYGSREYGINLVWADPDQSSPSIMIERNSSSQAAIKYGERVAIHVRGGGYLRYGERKYGINLKWSDTPVYEWRLRNFSATADAPVDLTKRVGLFNITRSDYLFYDPRRYGINLKWVSDKGKHNSKPWYETVRDAVTGFLSELSNFVLELLNRAVGVVDFILTFFGIMLPKKVRIRIVILRDAHGKALLADSSLSPAKLAEDQQDLQDAVDVIRRCFREQLNTRVLAAAGTLIETLAFPAPQAALHVQCGTGAWGEDFGDAGHYFRQHSVVGRALGYGDPITVFVVDDVEGKVGCSLGPLTNYVVVGKAGMRPRKGAPEPRPTTPMHEIGHSCGLWHRWPEILHTGNLMKSGVPRGIILELYQRAIVRDSRHVTFL